VTTSLNNLPTDDLVAVAWIGSIPAFSPSFVTT